MAHEAGLAEELELQGYYWIGNLLITPLRFASLNVCSFGRGSVRPTDV
jgi:hypothetical protein